MIRRIKRWLVGVGAALGTALLAALLSVPPAAAATLSNATLKSTTQVVTWSGRNADPTGSGFSPPTEQTCTESTCDSFLLKLELPKGTFPKGPLSPAPAGTPRLYPEGPTDMPGDGVLITIHWGTDFDQWNLYVYNTKTGRTLAKGVNADSTPQSALLNQPQN